MLLLFLIVIPFLGGLLCWQSEFFSIKAPRWIALFTTGLVLLIIVSFLNGIRQNAVIPTTISQWQTQFFLPWIPRFGINIHLALDGLSLLMIVLTGLLGLLSVLCSWNEIKHRQGFFYLFLLWSFAGAVGVFLSIDMFLFFFFWEEMLIPIYFLIVFWGNKSSDKQIRISAATKFFMYTQISGLIMLLSVVGLVLVHYNATGIWTFNYEDLLDTPISKKVEYLLMLGFFLSFAIKIPVFPLHTWLPDAHTQSPTSGAADLAGIMIKTALYGILRFSLPLFPHASYQFSDIAMWLGVVGIFYGAWMAFSQTNIKRLIAYTNISHMGLILVAIYSGSVLAYQGALIQIVAHSLSSAGMFVICGQLYDRLHTYDLRQMGGIWGKIDFIPALSLLFAVAMLGMPGTGNFIGEIMILLGSYSKVPVITVIAACGALFATIYSLTMIQRVYYGFNKSTSLFVNFTLREGLIIVSLAVLLVILGLFPQPILNIAATSVGNMQRYFSVNCSTPETGF